MNQIFKELVVKFHKEVKDFQNKLEKKYYNSTCTQIDEYFKKLLELIK